MFSEQRSLLYVHCISHYPCQFDCRIDFHCITKTNFTMVSLWVMWSGTQSNCLYMQANLQWAQRIKTMKSLQFTGKIVGNSCCPRMPITSSSGHAYPKLAFSRQEVRDQMCCIGLKKFAQNYLFFFSSFSSWQMLNPVNTIFIYGI